MIMKRSIVYMCSEKMRTWVIARNVWVILLLLAFFGLMLFPIKSSNWDFFLLPLLTILVGFRIKVTTLYSKLIITYTLFVLLSCLYSFYYNHQALHLVVAHSYKYFSLLFFFYLVRSKLTAIEAEKILITVSIICCSCYILQWLIYPVIIFSGADDETKASLEYYRVRIPGSISCYCLLLYGINKFLHDKKVKNLIYMFLGGIPITIMGFRSLVTLSVVFSFLMIPFVVRSGKRTIIYSVLAAILAVGVLQTDLVQTKLVEMERRTEANQTFANEDYIRYLEFDYYWNDCFTQPGEKFIGGGVPVDVSTKYRQNVNYGSFAWTDIGLVGLSMIIGMPAVLILILLYLICIWRYNDPHRQYLRFTLLLVLLGSLFTTAELYRDGNILLFSLFLYIEFRSKKDVKTLTNR